VLTGRATNLYDHTGDEITLDEGRADYDLAGSPALSVYVVAWPEVSLMHNLRLIKSVIKNKGHGSSTFFKMSLTRLPTRHTSMLVEMTKSTPWIRNVR
jgi:hypothetical protein